MGQLIDETKDFRKFRESFVGNFAIPCWYNYFNNYLSLEKCRELAEKVEAINPIMVSSGDNRIYLISSQFKLLERELYQKLDNGDCTSRISSCGDFQVYFEMQLENPLIKGMDVIYTAPTALNNVLLKACHSDFRDERNYLRRQSNANT